MGEIRMKHSSIKAVKRTWRPIQNGALIVGLGMAVGACERGDVKEGVPPPTPTTPDTMDEGAAEPIRDVDVIIIAVDRTANLNRQVELTNTQVQRVASDGVFWIGANPDRTIPVYLDDEVRRSLPANEPQLQMGDRVTLMGEIRRSPSTEDLQSKWKLAAQEAEQVRNAQIYIHATRLMRVVEPAPGQPGETPRE